MANCIGYHCASSRHMNSLTFLSFALHKHDKLDCLVMYNALNLCIYRIYEIIRETLMDKKIHEDIQTADNLFSAFIYVLEII